jgi:hypothetical protein
MFSFPTTASEITTSVFCLAVVLSFLHSYLL